MSIRSSILSLTAIIACAFAFLSHEYAFAQAQVAPSQITATADSMTYLMGDRVSVSVEILKNSHKGYLLNNLEPGKDYFGLDFLEMEADSTSLGNGREQLTYHLTFQAFTPADILTLPPFSYVADGDTINSDILTFRVLPVELSPELGDLSKPEELDVHPNVGPLDVQHHWYDSILAGTKPWMLWMLLGFLLIMAAVVTYFIFFNKKVKEVFMGKAAPSPYELARRRLDDLKKRRLLEKGQTKTYYTELVDILRSYLEGRFGIFALEMPSRQILERLREHKETHLSSDQMEQVLQLADFVKFAAAHPDPSEGTRVFSMIYNFVESTKPQADDKGSATKSTVNKKKKSKIIRRK